jgi:hypothetical protein
MPEEQASQESLARKERSNALLRKENIPYNDWLPVIETVEDSKRRTTEEVALRAIALCIVAVKAEGLEQEAVDEWIEMYDIKSVFTPDEKTFIDNANPSGHVRTQFAWRYECLWVMLWALNYIDELKRPEDICDVAFAVKTIHEQGRDKFIQNSKLRAQKEILDAADLIYRYHWAVRDAHINGKEIPGELNGDVIMERHKALNWLIGYSDQEWDDITTDT